MTKKFFTLLLAVAASVGTMFAWDYERVQIGDLYYNLDATNQTAEVTYKSYTINKGWGITTANIPASVEYYGVGYSVTSIGNEAFFACSGLTSITIPNSVTSIGEWAFAHCTGLTSVTIPNSVTSIGDDAFQNCSGLTSVTIGNSVTSIGYAAFAECSGLTSVTIPNSVTSIGEYAFDDCTGLTSVTIPNSVTSIGEWAFASVLNIVYSGSATGSPWGARSINGYVDGYFVYSDETKTNLLACSSAATGDITIPNSVTSIGEYAFEGCTGLTSVTIPNSVTSIGDYAFDGCSSLTSPVYNAHVFAFMPTSYSGGYTIPDGIEYIASGAFFGCEGLTSITIPNSVTSIGDEAFSGCSGLTSVVWNAKNCSDFASNNTPFYADYKEEWGYQIQFDLRPQITSFTFGNEVEHIPAYLCNGMSNLTSIVIPNSVTSIGDGAFAYCSGLTSVTIPNSVTSIGEWAFNGCTGLTSVTIPNSVTSIGGSAFSGCTGLTSVTIEAETPPTLGEKAFYGTNNCPIYVPCNAVNAYKTAWSEYADRIVANCASYTITFVNWDGSNLQTLSVTEGEMPQYTGSTPARPDDEEYTYTFFGWTPQIVAVTADATYTANYTATPKSQDINDVQGDNVQCTKLLRDGQILILRGEKVYTIDGRKVR